MVVNVVGGTRWSIRSAHLVGNLLFVLCAAQRREYLSCYIDPDPMGYSWRTLAVPSFHHFRSFPLTPSTLHTHKIERVRDVMLSIICGAHVHSHNTCTFTNHFNDLCVARSIHASESGNCTSRGIGTDSLVNDYQTFRPNLGSSSVVVRYRAW